MIRACPHCPNRSDQGSFIGDLCTPCHYKRNPKPKPERTEVYDAVNRDRLLGTIPKPDMRSSHVRMAAMPRMAVCDFRTVDYSEIMETTVRTVTMEANIKRGPNPLDVKGVLTTYDPLSDLLKLRDFRLPGESERAAEERRYYGY